MDPNMYVIKRDGTKEEVSFDKVLRRIQKMSYGLHKINPTKVSQKVLVEIVDGIHTSELDNLTGEICAMMIPTHPEYGTLASRIVISNLQKETPSKFSECINILASNKDRSGNHSSLVSEELIEIVRNSGELIDSKIDDERDFIFDYFGFKTLERSYLMKSGGKIIERPQYMWMRVSLGIHGKNLKKAFETYDLMSQGYFTHATPTLFNSGTPRPQLSSCFLMGTEDSVEAMYNTIKGCALISKWSGGIGVHISDIRSNGSYIRGTNGTSSGILPLLRVLNNTATHINQGGKRNGSIAVYLEPWHADVEDFLMAKRPHGAEEKRARDLFYALWMPDEFMRRVDRDEMWSLMCPDECPGLNDCWGDKFDELYRKYESEGKYKKQISARSLWYMILESQIETGVPYLLSKDSANRKSNQQNLGTIKSSNLCVAPETLIYTDKGHIPIKELEGQTVNVWNGDAWSETKVIKTGENQKLINVVVQIKCFTDNSSMNNFEKHHNWSKTVIITCTEYHKFIVLNQENKDWFDKSYRVDAKDLKIGDKLCAWNDTNIGEIYHSTIEGIYDYGRKDDTYCFNEPINHAGVFNGILTGNCSEIIEYSSKDECSVCNLASIGLPKFIDKDGCFDYHKLMEVVRVITNNLNKVIDINFYPTPETKRSNLRHRPIGIGIQGLADVFAIMKLPFDSAEARSINRKIAECIYYAAVEESVAIAKNEGPYETFKGSPASEGKLQYHLWGDSPRETNYLDWDGLVGDVVKYGMRNSLLVAPMPTASTSQILGNNECFEPFTSNLYVRRVLSGEFVCMNKHLVRDLDEIGLWTPEMQSKLMANGGKVQSISEIPVEIKERYKTVWEIKQKVLIDMAKDRGSFVCQSQSMNLFFETPSADVLSSAHFYSWRSGLKTISYYIRSKPKAKVQGFSVDGCLTCTS